MTTFSFDLEPGDAGVGRIRIDDFSETFALDCRVWSSAAYRANWRAALDRLLARDRATVALMTERSFDPGPSLQRGWVLYREGDRVFVQERLFVPEEPASFDDDDLMVKIRPRETVTDDGDPISEWETTTSAIAEFLRHA